MSAEAPTNMMEHTSKVLMMKLFFTFGILYFTGFAHCFLLKIDNLNKTQHFGDRIGPCP
jgi:hypothetical protein